MNQHCRVKSAVERFLILGSLGLVMWSLVGQLAAQDQREPALATIQLVNVPLPLTGQNDDAVIARLEQIARQVESEAGRDSRPRLVLQFQTAEGSSGGGSEFEAALKLARVLTGERMGRVRTIAFLPRSVKGHAVLAVIACEEIILAPDAEFGAAGLDEQRISPLLRAGYEEIAGQRRTIPAPLALGMLDRDVNTLRVQTADGVQIISENDLPQLQKATTVVRVDPVPKQAGDMLVFTGDKWRHDLGYASHLASNLTELADVLKVPESAFSDNPLTVGRVRAVRVNYDGSLNPRLVDRSIRIMADLLKRDDVNLLVFWLRSEGGSLDEALRLAKFLALDIDHSRVRTVIYVSGEARGTAAIVALAGDELVMEEGAVLGREGNASIPQAKFEAAISRVSEIMAEKGKPWSPALVLSGYAQPVQRYTHVRTGEKRLFSPKEHTSRDDKEEWTPEIQPLELSPGISSQEAVELGLARHRVGSVEEIRPLYRIEGEMELGRRNWALAFIERLADRRIAGLLLFVGTLALFNELAHPGIGVPGFIAGVCFLLFFWANVLHGNADMLELLLFAAGVACLLVEMFIAPGAIIFGFGGAVLIVVSIVLASQTFVLPTNMYQVRQLPGSLFLAIGAGMGGIVGLFLVQNVLPHTPWLKRLVLRPPVGDEIERVQERERISSYDHLLGKYGVTITPLVPSGKIRVGDDVLDVVSDGNLIDIETPVLIVETLGSRVVVRRA